MENKHYRYSKQRDTILQVVRSTRVHPTADWIYQETRKHIPNISLGTVCRNLQQLTESGQILKLKDETQVRYDGNTRHHDHFRCKVCGKWFDIAVIDETELRALSNTHNFRIDAIHLELEGVCQHCLDKQTPASEKG